MVNLNEEIRQLIDSYEINYKDMSLCKCIECSKNHLISELISYITKSNREAVEGFVKYIQVNEGGDSVFKYDLGAWVQQYLTQQSSDKESK